MSTVTIVGLTPTNISLAVSCGNSLHAEAGPDLFYLEYSVSRTLFYKEAPLVLLVFLRVRPTRRVLLESLCYRDFLGCPSCEAFNHWGV